MAEIVKFYKGLFDYNNALIEIDPRVMHKGRLLDINDALNLIKVVTTAKIDIAYWKIDDDKSPGIDEFNARFFKYCLTIIIYDVYEAAMEFFEGRASLEAWNC